MIKTRKEPTVRDQPREGLVSWRKAAPRSSTTSPTTLAHPGMVTGDSTRSASPSANSSVELHRKGASRAPMVRRVLLSDRR